MSRVRKALIASLTALMVLSFGVRTANAIGFTWVAGNGDWHVAPNWAPFAPPVMGPPGLGDAAIIGGDVNVTLQANAQGLTGMLVQAQGDVFTNGNQLTVVDIGGTATATISGIGTTGNNTELFVESAGGITAGFIADNLNLVNGGELDLTGGGITHVRDRLDVDAISTITGDGTIVFTDSFNVAGRRLDLRGTIQPDSNDTITLVAESGTIDLDGFVHNDNLVDLTNTGSGLVVDGPLSDTFTGTIEMGSGSTFTSTHDWQVGASGGAGGASLINVDAGAGEAKISGSEITVGGDGAHVNVLAGLLRVEADSRFQSNADVFVASGAEMKIGIQSSDATITGGSWTGQGAVNLDAGLNTIAANTTVNMPNGTFDIDGNTTGDTVAIDRTLTLNVASVDDEDFNRIDGTTQINGAAGQLNVQLTGGGGYEFEGVLDLNGPGGGFAGTHLAGSDVELSGTTSVSGNSRSTARVDLSGAMNIAANGRFSMAGGSANNPNTVRSSASFSGGGVLAVESVGRLSVEDGATIGVDVENAGRFEPGTSIGTVSMTETFTQSASGTFAIEIAGPGAFPAMGEHDQLLVDGSATIDGTLEATLTGGYVPAEGSVYTVLAADSVSGTFDTVNLLSEGIVSFDANVAYPGTRVVLTIDDVMISGDFNDDLGLDCADVDALVAEIASAGGNLSFDLTGDGMVNTDDLDQWLADSGNYNVGGPYLPGDATLDGFVDNSDFNVWNGNKFTSGNGWCGGDFSADGVTDISDFNIWNGNKYTSSTALASVVPEPASGVSLLLALASLGGLLRRRR